MNLPTFQSLKELLTTSEAIQRFFDAGLKTTLLLAALLLAVFALQRVFRMSAARRASVLLIGAMAVPIIAVTALSTGGQGFALWKFEIEASPAVPEVAVQPEIVEVGWVSALASMFVDAVRSESTEASPPTAITSSPPATSIAWTTWILAIWIGGMVLVALRLSIGIWALNRRLHRLARPAADDRLMRSMRRAATELGLSRLPELWIAEDDTTMPMTWGTRRHRVLLPAGADSWDSARLMLVLRHELGHVQRRDCLAGWTMRLLLAPTWFHPLAWMVARQADDLRERACDDLVTTTGGTESYARELVALSRRHHPLVGAVAMAKPKRMEARIRALFCTKLDRTAAGTVFKGVALLATAAFVLPLCLVTSCQTVETPATAKPAPSDPSISPAHAPTSRVLEAPSFAKGDKRKVVMRAYEITIPEGLDEGVEQSETEKQIRELASAKGQPVVSPALVKSLWSRKGTDILLLPAFPTGKRQTTFIGERLSYPMAEKVEVREVGVKTTTKVDELRGGKIAVEFDLQIVEFEGFDETPDGNDQPLFATRKTRVGPRTIENGAGLCLGLVREDVQSIEDKVPVLGDIPLAGRLFRSRSEITLKRFIVVNFEVTDR